MMKSLIKFLKKEIKELNVLFEIFTEIDPDVYDRLTILEIKLNKIHSFAKHIHSNEDIEHYSNQKISKFKKITYANSFPINKFIKKETILESFEEYNLIYDSYYKAYNRLKKTEKTMLRVFILGFKLMGLFLISKLIIYVIKSYFYL